ncbi:RNA-binding domain-containing protein [Anaerolentibacter hominis]|uniref:RNA-binding domain-containing protein n=1 Tax=Anaerolentibacter hominis TaxID=3079009 RepID=UPI0031B84E2B
MFIQSLKIHNFGPLGRFEVDFTPGKISLLKGRNASGKTNVLAALYSFFHGDRIINYYPDSVLTAQVDIRAEERTQSYHARREYDAAGTRIILDNLEDAADLAAMKKYVYLYTNEEMYRHRSFSEEGVRNALRFITETGCPEQELLERCLTKESAYLYLSGGEQTLIRLLCIISSLPDGTVFLGDNILSFLDAETVQRVLRVMGAVHTVQFIITSNTEYKLEPEQRDQVAYIPVEGVQRRRSPISFNYRNRQLPDIIREEEKTISFVSYRLGEKVPLEECRNTEFKEILGESPCKAIVSNAEVYVVSFLNSQVSSSGTILWGIRDDRTVKGVLLSYSEKDKIRRRVTDALGQAEPYISPDLYTISFQNITDAEGEIIPDLYVVAITVRPFVSELLFQTSKGTVYIKTESGRKKLNCRQTQEELLSRLRARGMIGNEE